MVEIPRKMHARTTVKQVAAACSGIVLQMLVKPSSSTERHLAGGGLGSARSERQFRGNTFSSHAGRAGESEGYKEELGALGG